MAYLGVVCVKTTYRDGDLKPLTMAKAMRSRGDPQLDGVLESGSNGPNDRSETDRGLKFRGFSSRP